MFRRRRPPSADLESDDGETVITRNSNIEGSLKADGTVKIYGSFEGEIATAGTLIVGREAQVVATISVHDMRIAGTVRGNIIAAGRVEIFAGGKVWGDIAAATLRIEEGAFFSGQSLMREGTPPLELEAEGPVLSE